MISTAVTSHWYSLEWAPLVSYLYVSTVKLQKVIIRCSVHHV